MHQPSHYYGVNSLPLGKARDAKGREAFDRDDLATGSEIVAYYAKVLAQFEASGRVDVRMGTSYDVGPASRAGALLTKNGAATRVVPQKTVTCISNVQVPSMRPPPFPVSGDECRPLNALAVPAHKSYVVVGAGKSGVDAVCQLLDQGVAVDKVTWIVPHDRWMFLRDGLCGNQISGAPRHRRDGVFATASARCSPLHVAARGSGPAAPDMVTLLVQHKADVNVISVSEFREHDVGLSVLGEAISHQPMLEYGFYKSEYSPKLLSIVATLLRAGANLDACKTDLGSLREILSAWSAEDLLQRVEDEYSGLSRDANFLATKSLVNSVCKGGSYKAVDPGVVLRALATATGHSTKSAAALQFLADAPNETA